MPDSTAIEKRNRAIIAFIISTSARDGALIGVRLKHVNIDKKFVTQDPKEVATKFGKRINSTFFPVGDDIHQIIIDWVTYLREEMLFADNDPLFPKEKLVHDAEMSFKGGQLSREHWQSATSVRGIFKEAFEAAGLPYFPPHSFRHTLSALGRTRCHSTEDQMAWARNMGHENPTTTFGTYGGFSTEQQFEVMARLSRKAETQETSNGDIAKVIQAINTFAKDQGIRIS